MNVISGNTFAGIRVVGAGSGDLRPGVDVVIGGNRIGTNAAGDAPLGNGREGILIDSSSLKVHVNSHHPAPLSFIPNLISGNGASGVRIVGPTSANDVSWGGGVTVFENFIGTDASGTRPLPNGQDPDAAHRDGVTFTGRGSVSIESNTISANPGAGIALLGDAAGGTFANLKNNQIGTDASGAAALGNAGHGVFATRVNQLDLDRNLISANGGSGAVVTDTLRGVSLGEQSRTLFSANRIGTTKPGTAALGNAGHGIEIRNASEVTIGGPNPMIRRGMSVFDFFWRPIPPDTYQNLISANGGHGVYVAASGTTREPSNIRVVHNLIGSDINEQAILGNGGSGVSLTGVVGATIGGVHRVAPPGPQTGTHNVGNLLSGNGGDGITIANLGAAPSLDNVVELNTIGRLPRAPGGGFGNSGWGVAVVNSSGNRIGGVPAAQRPNTIAHNGRGGILVRSDGAAADRNAISANSIDSNAGPGIDLGGDGVSFNDPLDADAGVNGLQNFPVITRVLRDGSGTTISVQLSSVPRRTYRVELFANASPDPAGHGEGERFLGAVNVRAIATGNGTGTVNVPALAVSPRSWLTATATDPAGNTSEFSPAVRALRARPVFRPAPRAVLPAAAAAATIPWYEPDRRGGPLLRGLLS